MSEITTKITSIEPAEDRAAEDGTHKDEVPAREIAERLRPAAADSALENGYESPSFGWVKAFTFGWIFLWLAAAAFVLFGLLKVQNNYAGYDALAWGGIAVLILAPLLLIWVCGYALKQLAGLSGAAQAMTLAGEKLSQPDNAVVGKTKTMAGAIAATPPATATMFEDVYDPATPAPEPQRERLLRVLEDFA